MRSVSRFRRMAEQQVAFVLAHAFDERRDGEAAHQLGDVIDEVGIRGDVVRFRQRRAQRLEQDGQAAIHRFLLDGGIAAAVVIEDAEAIFLAGHARDADDQRVRRGGILLLQLRVAIGIDEVGQLLLCQPGMQRGSAPLCIAIGRIEELVHRRAATLQLHVHRRTRKFVHQLGRHRLAVVHRDDQAVAVGGDGLARGRVDHAIQRARAKVGDDAAVRQAGKDVFKSGAHWNDSSWW